MSVGGGPTILIVDEAQNLSHELLEQIRGSAAVPTVPRAR